MCYLFSFNFEVLKMKAKILFACLVLLLTYNGALGSLADTLNSWAEHNKTIPNIFKPSKGGFLGYGCNGFAYRGFLLNSTTKMEVAMKFTPLNRKGDADSEYEMYKYLNAVQNPSVELYGIPNVYYYDTWQDYKLMAITLLESNFLEKTNATNEVDLLIIFQQFVIRTIVFIGAFYIDLIVFFR
ncbi:uncharacterized protein LOC116347519 [Contarinia nasturtii]|uniref:uncharacterized protein LOC116347519 n=1 Tax=Contarinia nasturtii TaxID=265458 RepID=UPI0012D433AD|nr:uncharacterized protein LOC116347519 [Contarinia nasturtii]